MKHINFVFLIIVFVLFQTFSLIAMTQFPNYILNQSFKKQSLFLDSLRNTMNNIEFNKAFSKYKDLEVWAIENKDYQLANFIKIRSFRFVLDHEKSDSIWEKRILNLIKENEEPKQQLIKAEALQLLADFYWRSENKSPALEYYLNAYDIYTQFSIEDFPNKAEYLYEIGGRYYHFADYQTALKYFMEVWNNISIEKIDNAISKLNTVALCYGNSNQLDSSYYYFDRALEIAKTRNDEIWISIISGNVSFNLIKEHKYQEAIPLLLKHISISEKYNQKVDLAYAFSEYSSILITQNEPQKALEYIQNALKIIDEKRFYTKFNFTNKIYLNAAKAFAANGNFEKAYQYYDSAFTAKDSLVKQRNIAFILGVELKNELEKHKSQIQQSEEEIKDQKFLVNVILIGFILMFLSSWVFFLQQRRLKKTQNKLVQSEKMATLGQLSASISHEVNTPLGAIKSSAEEASFAFEEMLNNLFWFTRHLSEDERELFITFISNSKPGNENLSTKEEREIKKQMREIFTELEIENSRYLSDRLVQIGIYEVSTELKKLAKLDDFEKLILLTYNIFNQKRTNQTIQLAVNKAARIVKALKTYIHTSDSNQKVAIDLRENLETVLTIYHNRLKQGIEVIKNYEEVPNILAYPEQLNQVWTNLIINAVQAMENKGILTIGIKNEDDFVIVSIGDTGKGIPKNIQNKIFEPFFTTKVSGEGSGLGLDIIKRILNEHSAQIYFESEMEIGTTFYVKLLKSKH